MAEAWKLVEGQLISKCPFGVIVWTKIPTKFFPGFLSKPLKRYQIKKIVQESQSKNNQLVVESALIFFDLTSFGLEQKFLNKFR